MWTHGGVNKQIILVQYLVFVLFFKYCVWGNFLFHVGLCVKLFSSH